MNLTIENMLCEVPQYHRVTSVSSDGSTVVAFQVGAQRSDSSASFLAVVAEGSAAPIVIAETDIVAPASSWEFRGDGLWVDHICETPFRHWSYGLEAFALQLDDPIELLGRGYGDRVPLGWELEFESDSDPLGTTADEGPFGYVQDGVCSGILLFKSREVAFEGRAIREHWSAMSAPGHAVMGSPASQRRIALPIGGGTWWLETTSTSVLWQFENE